MYFSVKEVIITQAFNAGTSRRVQVKIIIEIMRNHRFTDCNLPLSLPRGFRLFFWPDDFLGLAQTVWVALKRAGFQDWDIF